jgi:hypothetical protein
MGDHSSADIYSVMSDFQAVRGVRNMENHAPAMSGTSSSKLENLIVLDVYLEPTVLILNGAVLTEITMSQTGDL